MLGVGVVVAAGLVIASKAVRAIREHMEDDEERATAVRRAAHAERVVVLREHARLHRDRTRRQYEYESRALLLDQLTRIQARARKRISSIEAVLNEVRRFQGGQLEAWIAHRRTKELPLKDIDALRLEFRTIESLLCRKQYMRQRMFDLIGDASALKHELTHRSVHFRDAQRFEELLPDEAEYLEVPQELPKRYDIVVGECRPTARGLYFKLPCGIKGRLRHDELLPERVARGVERPVYVWHVNYRDGEAVVSAVVPKILQGYENDPRKAFSAEVTDIIPAGARLLVEGQVRAFMPRRRILPQLEKGQSLPVCFQQLDKFLDSPVVLPVATLRAGSSNL